MRMKIIRWNFLMILKICFKKKGKVVMEQDMESKVFWFDYDSIWSFFERVFDMKYQEIKGFLNKWLEETFKLEGYTPFHTKYRDRTLLEETFKLK